MTPITRPIRRAAQVMGVDPQLLADCLHDCPQDAVMQATCKRGAEAEQTLLRMLEAAHPIPAEGLGLTSRPGLTRRTQ